MRDRRAQAGRYFSAAIALLMLSVAGIVRLAHAEGGVPDPATAAALAGEVAHAQHVRILFPDGSGSSQKTPPLIPEFEKDADPSGIIATFQPNGPTQTDKNAFFSEPWD